MVLSRHKHQKIMIGDDIQIEVLEFRKDKVRIGITAPEAIPIWREEVWVQIQDQQRREALATNGVQP